MLRPGGTDRPRTVDALRAGGLVAAEEEADDLIAAARSPAELAAMVARRLDGEPTAWITGRTRFCGLTIRVDHGVYVPRWKTEMVAAHALAHLPPGGTAVDLCTGSGAVGAVLARRSPASQVLGTDLDALAVACAEANGVDARAGSLFDPLPRDLRGAVDVVVAVPPYVPDGMLRLLPPDVTATEPLRALSGGDDGLRVARRIVEAGPGWLRAGGSLVVEVGVDQIVPLEALFVRHGFRLHAVIEDGDGDPAAVCGSTPA